MFVYHFIDPDLRAERFFEKERTAENGVVDFEIGEIGTFAHLYCMQNRLLFYQLLKAFLTCISIPSVSNSFDLPRYSSELRKSTHYQGCCYVQRRWGKGVPVFLGEIGRGFVGNYCLYSSCTVLNMKYRSEFKHGFTNRGCLHCAISKALDCCKEKRVHKAKGMQFFFQNV